MFAAGIPWEAPRQLLWPSLAFIGALLVLALVVAWMDRWRKRQPQQGRLSTSDQLAHFRTLYERGEMSPEEYARVHALLAERLKKEMDALTPPPPGERPPEAPAPAPTNPRDDTRPNP
jgi:hypothetical protein